MLDFGRSSLDTCFKYPLVLLILISNYHFFFFYVTQKCGLVYKLFICVNIFSFLMSALVTYHWQNLLKITSYRTGHKWNLYFSKSINSTWMQAALDRIWIIAGINLCKAILKCDDSLYIFNIFPYLKKNWQLKSCQLY